MKLAPAALCAGFCAIAFSQTYDSFRANVTGTSGEQGKCTIEVVVDGVSEFELKGTQARMRTLNGARAAWRRLDCNMALPPNPANFRMIAKPGRGKQTLLHEPAKNGGVAVVRLEDPVSGSQPYKIEFEWRGVTGGFERSGLNSGGLETGKGGVIDDAALAGWNDRIEFRGPGEGYYHSFSGADALLSDCEVIVEPSGHVQVRLMTKQKSPIMLTGRLVKGDDKHLVANVSGESISGAMDIVIDKRKRVKELAMMGQNRFELRWQSGK